MRAPICSPNGTATAPYFRAMDIRALRFGGRCADGSGMPDTQTVNTIPRPIAAVLRHHVELQTAYVRRRALHDKTAAFVGAVSDVLSESDVRDLSHLISGSYDASYDAQRGAEFGQLLLDDLEQSFQDVCRIRDQALRWRHLDSAGVVEALTTDLELARLFEQALEERNETTAEALVSNAVKTIVEKASMRHTAAGQRRALEAATQVLRRHATEALGRAPQLARRVDADDAVVLAVWCEALYVGISAVL
jgi:hypothetical protein